MDIKQEKRCWIGSLLVCGLLVCCGLLISSPSSGENIEISNDSLSGYIELDSEGYLVPVANGQKSDFENSTEPFNVDALRSKETQVDKKQRLKNQEVLNHLYRNIKLYDSGVLNYDKKIN